MLFYAAPPVMPPPLPPKTSITVKIEQPETIRTQGTCESVISSIMSSALFHGAKTESLSKDVTDYLGDKSSQLKMSALNADCQDTVSGTKMAGVDLRTITKEDVFPLLLMAGENSAHSLNLPFLQRLELEGGIDDGEIYGSVTSVQPLWKDELERNYVFAQLSWFRSRDDNYADTVNAGVSYRFLNAAQTWLMGANLFLDHAYEYNHNRLGIGIDARTSLLALAINRYLPLSDWKRLNDTLEERASGGWDLELRGQHPALPSWTGTLKGYTWDGQGDDPRVYGAEAGLEYSPIDLVTVRAGVRDESRDDPSMQLALRLNWRFDQSSAYQVRPRIQLASVKDRVYDKVRRENRTRVSHRVISNGTPIAIPSGYSVTFTSGPLTPANHTAASFDLSGAEIGATYNYVISSSGGGITVTGTGTVATATQSFGPLDVSSMQDGTLTVSITLTGTSGGVGTPVTDTVNKNARYVCATAPEGGTINASAPAGETFVSVDFASYGTPGGTCGSYTVGACHAANSSTLVGAAFIGNNSSSIGADNGTYGDPCSGTLKNMLVQLRY